MAAIVETIAIIEEKITIIIRIVAMIWTATIVEIKKYV